MSTLNLKKDCRSMGDPTGRQQTTEVLWGPLRITASRSGPRVFTGCRGAIELSKDNERLGNKAEPLRKNLCLETEHMGLHSQTVMLSESRDAVEHVSP